VSTHRRVLASARLVRANAVFVIEDTTIDGCWIRHRRSLLAPEHPGPPLVVIPGVALSGRYMLPAARLLAANTPVWVVDPPGAGGSHTPPHGLHVPTIAEYLARWIDHLGVGPVALLGNSMGCQIATEISVLHPHLVERMVLQGPTLDADHRSLPHQLARLGRQGLTESPSLVPLQLVDWIRTGPRRTVAGVRAMLEHRIEERLPLVTCPTLIVRGSRDHIVTAAWANALARCAPGNLELKVVPGAGHAMAYSQPSALAELTGAFLDDSWHRDDSSP
jgi:2-hydroxy-6-oxonona-2,4-dienedioate hydrolase